MIVAADYVEQGLICILEAVELGATTPQIAAIGDHAMDDCQWIAGTYLPRPTEGRPAAVMPGSKPAWSPRG